MTEVRCSLGDSQSQICFSLILTVSEILLVTHSLNDLYNNLMGLGDDFYFPIDIAAESLSLDEKLKPLRIFSLSFAFSSAASFAFWSVRLTGFINGRVEAFYARRVLAQSFNQISIKLFGCSGSLKDGRFSEPYSGRMDTENTSPFFGLYEYTLLPLAQW